MLPVPNTAAERQQGAGYATNISHLILRSWIYGARLYKIYCQLMTVTNVNVEQQLIITTHTICEQAWLYVEFSCTVQAV